MPKASCVLCHKTWKEEGFKMYHVPKNGIKRKKWAEACGVELSPEAKICGLHFCPEDFSSSGCKRIKLSGDAIPMVVDLVRSEPQFIEASTQTEPATNREELLEARIKTLEGSAKELENLQRNLNAIFTEGQLKKICNPSRTIHWTWSDLSPAIALHAAGPKAYTHLLKSGYPLPCESTVAKWVQKVKFEDGVLEFSIEAMRSVQYMDVEDKLCIFSFDEMVLDRAYEYDPLTDTVKPPSDKVQVVIARGLKRSWKQPVFCAYDCKMNQAILNNLISVLDEAGYLVVGVVSDMGTGNQGLWTELNISIDKTWFSNPVNGGKVFVFADAPHLLKLIRNHYLNTGLKVGGDLLTPRSIADVLKHTSVSDVSIVHTLSEYHLTLNNAARQNVKPAAQLFSHSTASAIRRCHERGLEVYKAEETARFVDTVNDWFDLLNSKLSTIQTLPAKRPFGMNYVEQLDILSKMDECVFNMRVGSKKTLLPFQKGILTTNSSLRGLYEYVKDMYGMQYILTYRLNQDIVENFFSAMRAKGGLHDHPTAMQFKYRLRRYLLARNTETLAARGNVELDDTEWLNYELDNESLFQNQPIENASPDYCTAESTPIARNTEPLAARGNVELEDTEWLNYLDNDLDNESMFQNQPIENASPDYGNAESTPIEIGGLHEDAIEYVAGYIIRKLGLYQHVSKDNSSQQQSEQSVSSYIDVISKGGLIKPSREFLGQIKKLEKIFYEYNGSLINTNSNFIANLIKRSEGCDCEEEVKKLFFKSRMYIRIKRLNKLIKNKQ